MVCNNPSCETLAGVSEASASCKACTGCGCRYCSVACQGADWRRHKQACQRMGCGRDVSDDVWMIISALALLKQCQNGVGPAIDWQHPGLVKHMLCSLPGPESASMDCMQPDYWLTCDLHDSRVCHWVCTVLQYVELLCPAVCWTAIMLQQHCCWSPTW